MGDATAGRELFNLNQAKQFMQTMLHASTIKDLIDADKSSSLRGMFYKAKHTVAGTKENTFDTQDESDPILEDLEVTLGVLREELHIFADNRGAMVGNITVVDKGDEIDCRRMGSGGYAIPSIVEPDVIEFKKCDAEFVLHVEKGTVWNRFNEDRFWEDHNCILTHGGGQPPRGVRRLLQRFNQELKLPIICLLDCDPWGHYIYSVIKQGSITLAFESTRLAIPEAKFLGIRAKDLRRMRTARHGQDRPERQRQKTRQRNRRLSLVQGPQKLAERDREDDGQRLQDGSRIANHQGHQLRDGRIRAAAVEEEGLVGLSDAAFIHPMKEIIALLSHVAPYPAGVIEVPHRIARTSFFPGGYGLWNTDADKALPPMPVGGIMVLGHDFHCEAGYRRVLKTNGENLKDPTWSKLHRHGSPRRQARRFSGHARLGSVPARAILGLGTHRCEAAHIPEFVTYRSKWVIALEQLDRAVANGVRFDWLTFDEWYGGKPGFLFLLEERGMNYVCEVPANFMCWPTFPRYNSTQTPFAAKRVDNACVWSKPFRSQKWQTVQLARETLPPQTWKIKAAQVHLQRDGKPTLKLLAVCGISTNKCFFTNFFMGLREGDKPMGTFPGSRDSGFVERCREFFLHQLRLQRPRLVLTLGQHVPRLLAPLSPALKPWNSADGFGSIDAAGAAVVRSAHFHCDKAMLHTTLVALVHPCMRNSNVHRRCYGDRRGDLAEQQMIFDGLESAGITASDARVT